MNDQLTLEEKKHIAKMIWGKHYRIKIPIPTAVPVIISFLGAVAFAILVGMSTNAPLDPYYAQSYVNAREGQVEIRVGFDRDVTVLQQDKELEVWEVIPQRSTADQEDAKHKRQYAVIGLIVAGLALLASYIIDPLVRRRFASWYAQTWDERRADTRDAVNAYYASRKINKE